jgi:hypothetical protein
MILVISYALQVFVSIVLDLVLIDLRGQRSLATSRPRGLEQR